MRDVATVDFPEPAAEAVRLMQALGADVGVVEAASFYPGAPPRSWIVSVKARTPQPLLDLAQTVTDRLDLDRELITAMQLRRADDGYWMMVFPTLRGIATTFH